MQTTGIIEATEADFAEHTAEGVTLVDFWAPWCGPCRMQGPIIEDLAGQLGEAVRIVKVNVEDTPSLARNYAVAGIPLLLVLKDGKEVERMVGLQPAGNLLTALKRHASL